MKHTKEHCRGCYHLYSMARKPCFIFRDRSDPWLDENGMCECVILTNEKYMEYLKKAGKAGDRKGVKHG